MDEYDGTQTNGSNEFKTARRARRAESQRRRRAIESQDDRAHRLSQQREIDSRRRANESQDDRDHRLSQQREANQIRRIAKPLTHKSAVNELANMVEANIEEYYIGQMTTKCDKCDALHFGKKPKSGTFNICCSNGKVSLPRIITHPRIVSLLGNRDDPNYAHFRLAIRRYNNALACASMGANVKPPPGQGPYCFRIQGSVYHVNGPLHPRPDDAPAYGQLYISDQNEATDIRMVASSELQRQLTLELSELYREINPAACA